MNVKLPDFLEGYEAWITDDSPRCAQHWNKDGLLLRLRDKDGRIYDFLPNEYFERFGPMYMEVLKWRERNRNTLPPSVDDAIAEFFGKSRIA